MLAKYPFRSVAATPPRSASRRDTVLMLKDAPETICHAADSTGVDPVCRSVVRLAEQGLRRSGSRAAHLGQQDHP